MPGQTFAAIPARLNDQQTDASWWNILATAGINIETILGIGGGAITETTFSFANNQSSPANVTGLLFDHTVNKSAIASVSQRIFTGSNELYCLTRLALTWERKCSDVEHFTA